MSTEDIYSTKLVEALITALLHDLPSYTETHIDKGTTRLARPDASTTGDSMVARIDVELACKRTELTHQEQEAVIFARYNSPVTYIELGQHLGVDRRVAKEIYKTAIRKITDTANGVAA